MSDDDPIAEWRALRPDQRGIVLIHLHNEEALTLESLRAAIGDDASLDVRARYHETATALRRAAEVLCEVATADVAKRDDRARGRLVSTLLDAIDALPRAQRASISDDLRDDRAAALTRELPIALARALGALVDPER